MILELKTNEEFPIKVDLVDNSPELGLDREDVLKIDQIRVSLSVQHSDEEYFCQGTAEADIVMECARCLGEYQITISSSIDFIARSLQSVKADEKDIPDDEEYVDLLDNLTADISLIVKQAIALSIPMKPICDESCKGLCPVCGVNKNEKECDCKTQGYDERWEGLSGLF